MVRMENRDVKALHQMLDEAGIERVMDRLTLSVPQRVSLLVESRDRLSAAVLALTMSDGESGD